MVWGFITGNGNFKIKILEGNVNSKKYIDVLENFFLDEITECEVKLEDSIFQQDNASCHVSKETKMWFSEQNINLLNWPPQSPDLNPIENLWNFLDSLLRKRQNEISTKQDLKEVIMEEVQKIPKEYILKLYKSMPRRLSELKKSKFDVINY